MNAKAQAQFLTWVKRNFPDAYYAALNRADNSSLAGLGEEEAPTQTFWQKMTAGLTAVGTTYLSLKNQRDAMKLNLARAEQGLPPIDAGVTAPVIRTQIDLPPDVLDKLTAGAGQQFNKVLLIGAAAVAAFFLFNR